MPSVIDSNIGVVIMRSQDVVIKTNPLREQLDSIESFLEQSRFTEANQATEMLKAYALVSIEEMIRKVEAHLEQIVRKL